MFYHFIFSAIFPINSFARRKFGMEIIRTNKKKSFIFFMGFCKIVQILLGFNKLSQNKFFNRHAHLLYREQFTEKSVHFKKMDLREGIASMTIPKILTDFFYSSGNVTRFEPFCLSPSKIQTRSPGLSLLRIIHFRCSSRYCYYKKSTFFLGIPLEAFLRF